MLGEQHRAVIWLAAPRASALASAHGGATNGNCYNCPPEWADWATELTAIQTKLGVAVPQDNKYSGQTLPQLIAEKANAVADVVYYGVSFGIQAQEVGVVAAYEPEHWDETRPA